MVELSPEEITRRERALIDDYGTAGTSLIQKVGQAAEQAFYALPDYRNAGLRLEYAEQYEQILFGARIEAARTAFAFHQEVARLNGKKFVAPKLKKEDFFATKLRERTSIGARPDQEPYQVRPFRELYKELRKSGSMTDAIGAGGARARILAQTDVQLARRQASLFARRANDNIVGYIRVLTGAESCGLCYVASTQRYRKGDLNPIHPGCDCGELPIYGDTDPGQVIDQYNLDRIRESFENKFGDRFGIGVDPSARDLDIGKFVQYKDGIRKADFTLVSVREHGELGPILTRRKEKFTTLADIEARKLKREAALAVVQGDPLEVGLRSPIRQALDRLDKAQTKEKVSDILRETLDLGVDDLTTYDVSVDKYREAARTLVDLQNRYPTPLDKINLKRGSEYASVQRARPVLNITDQMLELDETGLSAFQRDLARNIESGHFNKWEEVLSGTTHNEMRAVISHEYAHLLDQLDGYSMKPRSIATRLSVGGKSNEELFDLSKKYLTQFERSLYFDDAGAYINTPDRLSELKRRLTDEYVREEVSGYALKNPRELIAESFAQYEFLGDKTSPLAREISETLLQRQAQKVTELGLDVASQVTEAEVSDITADALSRLGDSPDVDADVGGVVVQAIRAAGLIQKKTSLTGATLQYVAQEVVVNELRGEIARRVEAEAAVAG